MNRIRRIRAAINQSTVGVVINTFPRALVGGLYHFFICWDTEIKLAMMKPGKEL